MPAILESHRRFRQFPSRDIVDASEIDGVELAQAFDICIAECLHPAIPAEMMMNAFAPELIVRQLALSLNQPECIWFDDGLPEPALAADRAIALARALARSILHEN